MTTSQTGEQQPVILLIGKEETSDGFTLKQWLEENEYITREASDVFEVIEEISDFTVRQCPDVILLEAESASQSLIEEVFQNSTESNRQVRVVPFNDFDGGTQAAKLSRLKATFNNMTPGLSRAAA
jgi:AmiR/NasT family two-component response regulator